MNQRPTQDRAAPAGAQGDGHRTHRDLLPRDICPAFLFKHLLTHSLDDRVYDDRTWPGDGHYWCAKTCSCVGPDDEHVEPTTCLPGRDCYDGPLPQP